MHSYAESIELKQAAKEGQRYRFDSTNSMDMKVKYTAAGQTQEAEQTITQVVKGAAEVVQVSGGRPVSLRIEFTDDCGGKIESSNGESHDQKASFAGQTIAIRRDSNGTISNDGRNISDADQKTLSGFINQNLSLFPKKAVSTGDSWDGDPADVAQQFGLDKDSKASAHYTLKQIQSVKGQQVADVAATVSATHKEGPLDITISAHGVVKVDAASGQSLSTELSGTIESDGLVTQVNPNTNEQQIIQVKGSGPIKLLTTIEMLTAEAVPTSDSPARAASGAD